VPADPNSAKKTDNLTVFFSLLGSAGEKAARKILVKSTLNHIQDDDHRRVLVEGKVLGLTPGLHGFHIHTVGDVGNNCSNTLGDFNPYNVNSIHFNLRTVYSTLEMCYSLNFT
jgi:hypothetical protein